MTSLTGGVGYEVSHLVDNYDWGKIDRSGGTVVDLGGSHGVVCVELCNRFSGLKCIVQELPRVVESAPKFEGDLAERVRFMVHNFFQDQVIKGADGKFLFCDKPDTTSLTMLYQSTCTAGSSTTMLTPMLFVFSVL